MTRLRPILLALVALAAPTTALAGFAYTIPVTMYPVSSGYRMVEGSVSDARSSANTTEYIHCYVRAVSATASQGVCYAQNAAGQFLMCTSSAENAMTIMRSINEGSHIQWKVRDGGYECEMMTVYNGSAFVQ